MSLQCHILPSLHSLGNLQRKETRCRTSSFVESLDVEKALLLVLQSEFELHLVRLKDDKSDMLRTVSRTQTGGRYDTDSEMSDSGCDTSSEVQMLVNALSLYITCQGGASLVEVSLHNPFAPASKPHAFFGLEQVT